MLNVTLGHRYSMQNRNKLHSLLCVVGDEPCDFGDTGMGQTKEYVTCVIQSLNNNNYQCVCIDLDQF